MKKHLFLPLCIVLLISITACASKEEPPKEVWLKMVATGEVCVENSEGKILRSLLYDTTGSTMEILDMELLLEPTGQSSLPERRFRVPYSESYTVRAEANGGYFAATYDDCFIMLDGENVQHAVFTRDSLRAVGSGMQCTLKLSPGLSTQCTVVLWSDAASDISVRVSKSCVEIRTEDTYHVMVHGRNPDTVLFEADQTGNFSFDLPD